MLGQLTVQMHYEPAGHTGKPQPLTIEPNTCKFSEPEGFPPSLATESGKASLPIAGLQAAKKSLKGIVQSLQCPALKVRWQLAHTDRSWRQSVNPLH